MHIYINAAQTFDTIVDESRTITREMAIIKKLFKVLEVDDTERKGSAEAKNLDARPLEPARRTYGPWEFLTLWVCTGSWNIGGWNVGSSLFSLGLNVWQSIVVLVVANIFTSWLCVLSGAPGAKWHVGFPILMRASWGVYGFVFVAIQRLFLGCIW